MRTTLESWQVNQSGDAYFDFCCVYTPRTIGFRFRYLGQGSGTANGFSAWQNFTWTAL